MIPWEEKWPVLRYGDVFPLPLATETSWAETWEVNVLVLMRADANGYDAKTVWSYTEPYAEPRRGTREEAAEVTERALSAFADRLQEVLADRA
jgi:hypothetical protein